MALSILVALTACPALLGTTEAIRQAQSKDRREEHRARRCNLIATCVKSSTKSREIDSRQVILRDGKLYLDTSTDDTSPSPGHPYAGYYLPYPETTYEGLVTTVSENPPVMNWVYVDARTYELKHGVRAQAQLNITGPFDCTRLDRRLTLEGWEGFVAVKEEAGMWAIYFDRDDNGLLGKVPQDTPILEVELWRKEKRVVIDPKIKSGERRN